MVVVFVQQFHHDYLEVSVNIELEHLFYMILDQKVVLVDLLNDFIKKFQYLIIKKNYFDQHVNILDVQH